MLSTVRYFSHVLSVAINFGGARGRGTHLENLILSRVVRGSDEEEEEQSQSGNVGTNTCVDLFTSEADTCGLM